MSFHEKSVWGSMLAVLAVYGVYFYFVAAAMIGGHEPQAPEFVVLNVSVVVALVVIEIVYHIIIAGTSVREEGRDLGNTDERDRAIESRAAGPSGVLLAAGVVAAILHVTAGSVSDSLWLSPIATANLLLLFLVAAQLFEYALQVIQYRREA